MNPILKFEVVKTPFKVFLWLVQNIPNICFLVIFTMCLDNLKIGYSFIIVTCSCQIYRLRGIEYVLAVRLKYYGNTVGSVAANSTLFDIIGQVIFVVSIYW